MSYGHRPKIPLPRRLVNDLGIRKLPCPPHFWEIDSLPTNGKYHARCAKCGAENDYPAYLAELEEHDG